MKIALFLAGIILEIIPIARPEEPVCPVKVSSNAYLCGGHHTYGHNDSWRVLPTWKEALDALGSGGDRT